jgi:nicotinate-nucleotide adenylyltransferase
VSGSLGVLGGAFNPPHVGHLLLAQEAIARLGLDELLLVPTGIAPHKEIDPEPGRSLRLRLTELAVRGAEGIGVSDLEVRREGPSFAYRTLELLHEERPGAELTFVMGADIAATIETWERPERVLELADVAVVGRVGTDLGEVEAAFSRLGAPAPDFFEMPLVEISSTLVRERIGAGLPVRWMVPDEVLGAIEAHGLYGAGVTVK